MEACNLQDDFWNTTDNPVDYGLLVAEQKLHFHPEGGGGVDGRGAGGGVGSRGSMVIPSGVKLLPPYHYPLPILNC